MKKLVLLALVLVMALSFAACGNGGGGTAPAPVEKTEVEAYIEEYGDTFIEAFESSFEESGGMTCESDIIGKGNDIILTTRVNEFDGLTAEEKQMVQEMFDAMNEELKASFDGVEDELPSLENFIVEFCESDGDLIANIVLSF